MERFAEAGLRPAPSDEPNPQNADDPATGVEPEDDAQRRHEEHAIRARA
jgi:hypothetical protein